MPFVTKRSSRPSLSRSSRAHRPRPVNNVRARGRQGTPPRGSGAGARAEIKRVVHHLRRRGGIAGRNLAPGAGVGHAALVLGVRAGRHVGDEQVDAPVVVHVAEVGAHRIVGQPGHGLAGRLRERAIAIVVIEAVGSGVVVGNVEIGPAVIVVIPPRGRVREALAADAGLIRHVGERAIAVVVEKVAALAVGMLAGIQHVRGDVHIEPAVAVVVAEGAHARGIDHGQPARRSLLLERPVALVDEKQIGRVETADIDIQQTVVVHVGEGHALLPRLHAIARGATYAGPLAHVLELPVAEIVKETGHPRSCWRQTGRVARRGRSRRSPRRCPCRRRRVPGRGRRSTFCRIGEPVFRHDPGLRGRQQREHRRARCAGARRERGFNQSAGGQGGGRRDEREPAQQQEAGRRSTSPGFAGYSHFFPAAFAESVDSGV